MVRGGSAARREASDRPPCAVEVAAGDADDDGAYGRQHTGILRRTAGTTCTNPFELLPVDTVGRILAHVPLSLLPRTIAAVRASSSGGAVCMAGDTVWQALVPRLDPRGGAPAGLSSRKSARLVRGGEASFVRAWGLLLTRAEALHHSVAVCGQDKRHLTLAKLKHLLTRFSCALVDHASPVYNATLLMEVCKARGTREANLALCAAHLLRECGCDANARPSGDRSCTPLVIASCRGLPRLVALLLEAGADPSIAGEGRFRLGVPGGAKTLRGCHTPRGWIEVVAARRWRRAPQALRPRPLTRARLRVLSRRPCSPQRRRTAWRPGTSCRSSGAAGCCSRRRVGRALGVGALVLESVNSHLHPDRSLTVLV
mmetsp:Transcript_42604/g.138169  ORF Transcript_42604/g.138169 Transcript_42604/m.138169 type:complete len:371 (-) Transcript_42604:139-1251(-)